MNETNTGRVFGSIPGTKPGDRFVNRAALNAAGVHRPTQAGISGSANEGADSIVVSGGYIDDRDYGNVIIYTGHGGNDPKTKRQIEDQKFERGNKALGVSCDLGLPIRVVRGADFHNPFAPASGYQYYGLFVVSRYW